MSRRTLLTTAALAAGPAGAVLTGCGGRGADRPARQPAPTGPVIVTGEFESRFRNGAVTHWRLALPPGTDPERPRRPDGGPLPVGVVLHGRGGNCSTLTHDGYEEALADLARKGVGTMALAALTGGDGYWHARRTGEDSGRTISQEFLPMLARRGLAAGAGERIALMGISMGGYGTLLLAETWGRERVAAVAALSPALWLRPGDSAPGAFDDREDYLRHDVFKRRQALQGIAVRVDCGRSDPFYRATRAFVTGLHPSPAGSFDAAGTTWTTGARTRGDRSTSSCDISHKTRHAKAEEPVGHFLHKPSQEYDNSVQHPDDPLTGRFPQRTVVTKAIQSG